MSWCELRPLVVLLIICTIRTTIWSELRHKNIFKDAKRLLLLFGGIELQRITRQKAEHRSTRPYTSTVPSIPPARTWLPETNRDNYLNEKRLLFYW